MTTLEELIERLKDLQTHEISLNGKIAYTVAIAAAESLLDEEQRIFNEIMKYKKEKL
jgi:hypothetical protein